MRYVVIALLAMILASLASALYFMMKRRDEPRKMAKALAVRVGLSVFLFLLLMVGWMLGFWQPHAL
ncbi:MAG: twin transmembrane helix small protein [Betaproteobacteria bacterium]|nr:twin transmembrane helix small protein [Betaproteobacteria bacterium]